MVTLVRPLQPKNADSPIAVTEFGMIVFMQPVINVFVEDSMIALQLSRESKNWLSFATVMLVIPEHEPQKAPPPMELTEFPNTILSILSRHAKAQPPMVVTELGIIICNGEEVCLFFSSAEQANAQSSIVVTELPISILVNDVHS